MITQGLETVAEPSGSRSGECVHFFEIYSLNLLQNNLPQSLWLKETGIYSLTVWCLETSHQGAGRTGFFWRLRKNPLYTFPPASGGSHPSLASRPTLWLSVSVSTSPLPGAPPLSLHLQSLLLSLAHGWSDRWFSSLGSQVGVFWFLSLSPLWNPLLPAFLPRALLGHSSAL